MNAQNNTQLQVVDTPHIIDLSKFDLAKPTRRSAKLTRRKKYEFFKEFAKDYNMSRAAHAIGVHRNAIYNLLQTDPEFKAAFQEIENAVLDTVESTSLVVALQASREGFNDRKLLLQAKRPEVYGNKLQVDQTTRLEAVVVHADLRNILTSNKLAIE